MLLHILRDNGVEILILVLVLNLETLNVISQDMDPMRNVFLILFVVVVVVAHNI